MTARRHDDWQAVLTICVGLSLCAFAEAGAERSYPVEGIVSQEDLSKRITSGGGWLYGLPGHHGYETNIVHASVDIGAPEGSEIRAVSGGVLEVVRMNVSGFGSGYTRGGAMVLRTDDGHYVLYGHTKDHQFRRGEPVKAGSFIGRVGPWHDTTHLHFSVRTNQFPQYGWGTPRLGSPPHKPDGFEYVNSEQAVLDCGYIDPIGFLSSATEHQVATSLVIDISTSMSGSKLEAAKNAIVDIIGVARNTAQALGGGQPSFGAVAFGHTAAEVAGMTSDLDIVDQAVRALSVEGDTNIGDGLTFGLSQASSAAAQSDRRIILLSDGQTNFGLSREQLMDPIDQVNPVIRAAQAGVKIDTVGFGTDADTVLLQTIANLTGGSYYDADTAFALTGSYLRAHQSAWGTQLLDCSDTISQGETRDLGSFTVARTHNALRLITSWPGSTVTGQLTDPRSRAVAEGYPGATFVPRNPSLLIVQDPLPGEWSASVIGTDCPEGSEPFDALVAAQEGERRRSIGGGGGAGAAQANHEDLALFGVAGVALLLLGALVRQRRTVAPPVNASPRWVMVIQTPNGSTRHRLPNVGILTIGRDRSNNIVLLDHEVSGCHAQLFASARGWMIVDIGSRNGTWIAGRRIPPSTPVAAAGPIQIGRTIVEVYRTPGTTS